MERGARDRQGGSWKYVIPTEIVPYFLHLSASKKPQAAVDVFGLNPEKRGIAAAGPVEDDFGEDDFM
jgi:hypothetical protein